MNGNGKRFIGDMGLDTRAILKRLTEAEIGALVGYEELNGLIGRDCSPGGLAYYALLAARKAAEREGYVFAAVKNEGVRRLDDVGIVTASGADIQHIGRRARRASRRLSNVRDFDKLPNGIKVQHNTAMSMFGVIAHVASKPAAKRLEKKIAEVGTALPLAKTLEQFV